MIRTVIILALLLAGCQSSHPDKDVVSEALQKGLQGLTLSEYQGKRLFEQHCVICHGESGKGDGFNAYNLKPPPPNFSTALRDKDDHYIAKVITEGTVAVEKSPLCPPRKRILSPEEQKSLLSYLRRLASPPSP